MFDRFQAASPPVQLRGHSERVSSDDQVAGRVHNFVLTRDGTLRTVVGPAEYHPAVWEDNSGGSSTAAPNVDYIGPFDGVHHASLGEAGARDVLLLMGTIDSGAGDKYGLWAHRGWNWATGGWTLLAGNHATADLRTPLTQGVRAQFLTQFVNTPGGVVIVPQNSRALFYDGEVIAPLGFSDIPAAPQPLGPRNDFEADGADLLDVANTGGFYVSGRTLPRAFGSCRIGTLRPDVIDIAESGMKSNPLGGVLEPGEWRAAVQFVDRWGNLSAPSGLSTPVTLAKEDNLVKDRRVQTNESAERLRVQLAWSNVVKGPSHTAGRILLRTADQRNSGRPGLFEVPSNASDGSLAFATIPDNTATYFPDNVPDSWLLVPASRCVPVPEFKLATFFAGSLWIANTREAPGMVRRSLVGRPGTFPVNEDIYPDAKGREVTGLYAVAQGLLVFTETSTFLINVNDSGEGVRASTLHPSVGCVSPNSIATLPNGLTVWMSREGFHAFDGQGVRDVSMDIKDTVRRVNKAWRLRSAAVVDPVSAEYRCWIPVDGSNSNNLCVVFDGAYWRERDDVDADAVCVTQDSRSLLLAAGSATRKAGSGTLVRTSVWVVDHEDRGAYDPIDHIASLETHWLRSSRSSRRATPSRVTLWFRETCKGTVDVEVMRDWREGVIVHTVSGVTAPTLYPNDDIPSFYDDTLLAATAKPPGNPAGGRQPLVWSRRRPYWTKADIAVPSCEVFRVRLKVAGDFEFVGLAYEEQDQHAGGSKLPTGVR